MRAAPPRAVTLALAALLGGALPAQDENVQERVGEHFKIVLHAGDLPGRLAGTLAAQALAEAERLWPVLQKVVGARGKEVHTIHVHRDEAGYRAIEAEQSPFGFPVEGFARDGQDGHVWLWPALREQFLLTTGLPVTTRDTLLRVAAEQVIAPLVPESDVDGFLRWVAVMGAVEAATNPDQLPGVDWAHDARRIPVVDRRGKNETFTLAELLDPDLSMSSRQVFDRALGAAAILAQGLGAADARWAKKLLERRRSPRGQPDEVALRRAAVQAVVGKDWGRAEARFAEVLRTIAPQWEARAPLWSPGRPQSLLLGAGDSAASLISAAPAPESDFVLRGRMTLGAGSREWVRIAWGWDETSMVVAYFEEDLAALSIWTPAGDQTRRVAQAKPPIASDRPFDFRLEVDGGEVRIAVDGAPTLAWQHGGRDVHGYVSIEVNDRLVWLEDLELRALDAKK